MKEQSTFIVTGKHPKKCTLCTNVCQINHLWKWYHNYPLSLLYNKQLLAHQSNTLVIAMQLTTKKKLHFVHQHMPLVTMVHYPTLASLVCLLEIKSVSQTKCIKHILILQNALCWVTYW